MTTYTYLGILAILYFIISVYVIRLRWKFKVGIGDGGQVELAQAMASHHNFASYVPWLGLLLVCLELSGAGKSLIHFYGSCLVLGRLSHFIGLNFAEKSGNLRPRQLGMTLTFIPLLGMGIRLLS
jgi:uncharacterized protein